MTAILVDANAAVVTAGGEDAPASGTVETLTVTTLAGQDWPTLSDGEWFHAIDAVDKGKTSNYELIKVTATANGTGVSWTATRGDSGTTPHAHTAGWTLIPVASAESLNSALGDASTDVPIANPTGITTGTETPDPISGADSAKWVEFPSDATVMAWGLAGDAFPRMVFSADPTDGVGVAFGDGTADPTGGPGIQVLGVSRQENGAGSHFTWPAQSYINRLFANSLAEFGEGLVLDDFVTGNDDGPGIWAIAVNGGGSVPPHFSTTLRIPVGSRLFQTEPPFGQYVCTVTNPDEGGTPTQATWALIIATDGADPITAGAVPPNAGALWQDTSGSGSLWISTGTSSGDWMQVGGTQGALAPVRVVSAFDTEVTSSPPSGMATIDGYAVSTGDRVLLTAQDTSTNNGIWIVNTAGDWTRPSDWITGVVIPDGTMVSVAENLGDEFFGSIWLLIGGDCTVGTSGPGFECMAAMNAEVIHPTAPAVPTKSGTTGAVLHPWAIDASGLPTTDPHVVGLVWSNSGILTVSAG